MVNIFITIICMVLILSVAAIGGSFSGRSGIINLSTEGFMIIGAIIYAMMSANHYFINSNPSNQFWLVLLAGLVTTIISIIFALIVVYLKTNQTISGIALNILAVAISLFVIHSKMNPNGSGSNKIDLQKMMWTAGNGDYSNPFSLINLVLLLAVPIIIILIVILNKTKLGIQIKTCGEQPQAAASLGINVKKTQTISVMISAGIAGIAGAIFVQFHSSVFYGTTNGLGFLALAIIIFGQWKPSIMLAGSLLFGGLMGLITWQSMIPGLENINSELLQILPFASSLVVLLFTQNMHKLTKRHYLLKNKNITKK